MEREIRSTHARTGDCPDEWLVESCEMIAKSEIGLRSSQRACDIACGLGHNSLWLARQGWKVDGIDIATEGLKLARQSASYGIAEVNWLEADLDEWLPTSDYYDLAIVFRFLDRVTVPQIVNAGLRPGGWLIYETFTASQLDRADSHIRNPAFTLQPDELPGLFSDYIFYWFREATLEDRTVQRILARRRW